MMFRSSYRIKEADKNINENDMTRGNRTRLCTFDELPAWCQDNPHIRYGYRPVCHSAFACIQSLLYLHNESINIYTHLLPALIIILGQNELYNQITRRFPEATSMDRLIFNFNIIAALVTALLSSTYHTLMNHSFSISALCLRIDYAGILLLIQSSFISGIYVGFYCEPFLQKVYWTMITSLSTITAVLVLHPKLQGPKLRSTRTTAFVLTGLSGFAPIGHGLFLYGWNEMWERSGMPFWLLEGAAYGIGAAFFATRIPERLKWGRFDIWGSSHQIFHVCVVAGAVAHLWGVWDAWAWNYRNGNVGSCGVRG